MKRHLVGLLGFSIAAISGACSSSGGTAAGTQSTGTGSTVSCSDAKADTTGCTVAISAGSDDTTTVQGALIDAKSGSTVCFCPGSYHFNQQLSLTVPHVTVKGVGATPEATTLDFAGVKGGGEDTMLVTADGFTIENLAVKNTPGNGVVVRQADSPTFRKLHVSWDGGPKASNGAYAIYPAECKNVLVEDNEVEGAADAAIYVGQGTGAIIRRNKAHDSVLGIELENTTNGEAYSNEAYNNSGGMAVFLLGNLTKKTADHNNVHDNKVHDNNLDNFGDPTTFVSHVPVGTGIIVVGADDTEIRNNTITGNESAATLVVSYTLMKILVPGAMADPMIDPDPERTFIHDNTFMNNGQKPHDPLTILAVPMLEDVLWDGIGKTAPAMNDAKFCIGSKSPWPSFRMFDGANITMGNAMPSTDSTPYQCDLPSLPSSPM